MIAMVVKIVTETHNIERIKEVAEKLVEKTKKEKGCIEYDFYINIEDKTSMSFIEKWESKDDLENHLNSEHFKKWYPEICKCKIGGETVLYEKHEI